MALQSVAVAKPPQVTQPDYVYSESDPFERITARLNGLSALAVVAQCAMEAEHGPPTKGVWYPLWYFVDLASQDMKRDLIEMREKAHA